MEEHAARTRNHDWENILLNNETKYVESREAHHLADQYEERSEGLRSKRWALRTEHRGCVLANFDFVRMIGIERGYPHSFDPFQPVDV